MIELLSLDQLRALPPPEPFDGGVYFLWAGETLQYIGGSSNIHERSYYQHLVNSGRHVSVSAKPIPHDRITALVLVTGRYRTDRDKALIQDTETAYLARYKTPYNGHENILPTSAYFEDRPVLQQSVAPATENDNPYDDPKVPLP